jgi:hypothetical protein
MLLSAMAQRRPMRMLLALVALVLVLDFSIPDGCDCEAARARSVSTR